jgi:hypothetical protein
MATKMLLQFGASPAAAIARATVIDFRAAEGAGDHCEMGNRRLLNGRMLDWPDDTLAAG